MCDDSGTPGTLCGSSQASNMNSRTPKSVGFHSEALKTTVSRILNNQKKTGHSFSKTHREPKESDLQKTRRSTDKVDRRLNGRRITTANDTKGYQTSGYFQAYYSTNFLGMDPIYCFHYDTGGASCFLLIGTSLFFPVLNSAGTGDTTSASASSVEEAPDWSSMYCNCSASPKMNADDIDNCNSFALFSSFIYFPEDGNPSSYDQFAATLNFSHVAYQNLQMQPDGDIYTSRNGYNVAASTIFSYYGAQFSASQWSAIYEPLCSNCTVITVFSSSMYHGYSVRWGL